MGCHSVDPNIIIPPGSTEKDMDWIAISWEMVTVLNGKPFLGRQYVISAGASIARGGLARNVCEPETKAVAYSINTAVDFPEPGAASNEALLKTESMRDTWQLLRKPFVVDFQEDDLHHSLQEKSRDRDGTAASNLAEVIGKLKTRPDLAEVFFGKVGQVRRTIPELRLESDL